MQLRKSAYALGLCLTAIITGGCSGAGPGNTAEAAGPAKPQADAIDELTLTLEEMGVRAASPFPSEPVFDVPPGVTVLGDPPVSAGNETTANVTSEVALLREHIHELERSLTFYMDTVVTDLREENAYLREELARIYATIPLEDRMRPLVPRPGSDVIANVQDFADSPQYQAQANNARLNPDAPLELTIAKEWGRTPEDAAAMGPAAPSLRGLIGSVPQGATDEALLEFARELREQYAKYTNINAVIFDSESAATAYAETNRKSTTRHVLTIARHAQTGLDEIYLHRNGLVVHTERF